MSEALGELLFEHNCVIIPDLGGFVTEYRSARLQPAKERIFPPHKALAFNPRLNRSDGVLTHYIARRQGIAYSEAEQLVRLWSAQCKSQLEQDRILVLPGVGKLLAERSGSWRFQPDERFNYWEDAFGLAELDARPLPSVKEPTIEVQAERVQAQEPVRLPRKPAALSAIPAAEETGVQNEREQSEATGSAPGSGTSPKPATAGRVRWLWTAAAAVLMGLGLWQLLLSAGGLEALQTAFLNWKQAPPVIEEGRAAFLHPLIPSLNRQMHVFGPTTSLSSVAPVAVLPIPRLPVEKNLVPDPVKGLEAEKKIDSPAASAAEEKPFSAARPAPADTPAPPIRFSGDQPAPPSGYYVILGSFPNKRLAEERLLRVEDPVGQAAVLHAENGRYRAGLFLGAEKQAAVSELDTLRERYKQADAWITRF